MSQVKKGKIKKKSMRKRKSPQNLTASQSLIIDRKKAFPWSAVIITAFALIVGIGASGFMYTKYTEREKEKKREELARIEKEKKMQAQAAAEEARKKAQFKRHRMEKYKKAYEDALLYAKNNKDQPHLVKHYFRQLREFFKGSKYEERFEAKSEKILARIERAELEKRKQELMSAIEVAVAGLVKEKEYEQVALYYRNYSGELAGETESERNEKAAFYTDLAKKKPEQSEKQFVPTKDQKKAEKEWMAMIENESGEKDKMIASKENDSPQKDINKKQKKLSAPKPGSVIIKAKVKKDIQDTARGKDQKIFPYICIENKSQYPLEAYSISTYIICQSQANRKEYCLCKIFSRELNMDAKSRLEIEEPVLSVFYKSRDGHHYTESIKLEYEGCLVALKTPRGELLAMDSDSARLNRIKDRILVFEEGTFFNRKGKKIVKAK